LREPHGSARSANTPPPAADWLRQLDGKAWEIRAELLVAANAQFDIVSGMAYNSDTMSNFVRTLVLPTRRPFFLFGPRGTGKSSLLEVWRGSIPAADLLWIDLLDLEVEANYLLRPHRLKEEILARPSLKWVVIDEVQKIPSLLDVAHWAIEKRGVRFAMTGSSARKLKRGAGNLLNLSTLNHLELGVDFDLEAALHWGTLPGLWALENDLERQRFLNSYVHTYLREEIQLEQIVRNVARFRQFLPLASQFHGEPLQFSKVASASGVDEKSIARYFEILTDTLIGIFLEPHERSVRKRPSQKPKFYLFDNGVRNAIAGVLREPSRKGSGEYGRDFESWIILEMHRLNDALGADLRFSYLRTKDDAEIDLIVERGRGAPMLIEIKASTNPTLADARHLIQLGPEFKGASKIILCQSKVARTLDHDVEVLPWRSTFNRLFDDLR
jgi:uncharacterized protein